MPQSVWRPLHPSQRLRLQPWLRTGEALVNLRPPAEGSRVRAGAAGGGRTCDPLHHRAPAARTRANLTRSPPRGALPAPFPWRTTASPLSRGEALFFEVPMLDVPHAMTTEPGETSFDLRKEAEEAGITGTLQQLEQELIGLKPVKSRVRQIASLLLIERIRQRAGLASSPPTLHMSFTGNPGTGKTTVALRMAKILHGLGFVRRGQVISVTRDDLVGQYIGHTAPKTKEILKKAMGGVLFIDEAYYLHRPDNERDYGQEAIEILLQVMEQQREDLVVILAGYGERMDKFFESNPGFRSRIAHHIDFPDYSDSELLSIAELVLQQQNYRMTTEATDAFKRYIGLRKARPLFSNARSIRNALDRIRLRQANRLVSSMGRPVTIDDVRSIEASDVLSSRVFGETSREPAAALPVANP